MEQFLEFLINHWALSGTFVGLLFLLLQMDAGKIVRGVEMLTPTECVQKINKDNSLLVDIRPKEQFEKGHIINSLNLSLKDLESDPKELQKYKDKPIIMICQVGQPALKAANLLQKKGFKNVLCLKGGLQAWNTAELPLV